MLDMEYTDGTGELPQPRATVASSRIKPEAQAGLGSGPAEEPCLVTTWRPPEMRTWVLADEEVRQLDLNDVCVHLNRAHGQARISRPDRAAIEHGSELPGIGDVALQQLFVPMTRPGRRWTPYEIGRKTNCGTLQVPQNFSGRLRAVRALLGESGDHGGEVYYLRSSRRPFVVWWNPDATFRVIEPLEWYKAGNERPGESPVTYHGLLLGADFDISTLPRG